ncbi:MAG: hypothetical protein Q9209_001437 [Squamulea sp. 1 TL-2023]
MKEKVLHQHNLALVYGTLGGKQTLEPIIVNGGETGQEIFEKVNRKLYKLLREESRLWFLKMLWTKMEVSIAEIRWTLTDKETACHGMRVDLTPGFEQHNLFSEAIRHPNLLAHESDFLMEYKCLALSKPDAIHGFAGQQVLAVYTVADKERIAWLLLLFLILSPALGLIVGHFMHRADVGVAVSAGVFACASFLQGLTAWLHK